MPSSAGASSQRLEQADRAPRGARRRARRGAEDARAKLGVELDVGAGEGRRRSSRSEVAAELAELAMDGARLEVAPRSPSRTASGPAGAEIDRAARRDQPRDADRAARRRGLRRRALAGDAGALRPRPGRRRRDARLRRDRRRRRRQGRAPRRRAAARPRRGAPGRLHHPPRAGRLAGRRPTSGSRRRPTAAPPWSPGSRPSPATSSSPRSSACSAPIATTRPPAGHARELLAA